MMYSMFQSSKNNYSVIPKARQASWLENRKNSITKIPQSVATAWCALNHGQAKDNNLARLDDATRAGGVAAIATLGSLGINQPGGSLPLWVGAASWLGAMSITPRVINSAVYMKTGVNPNLNYMNSNGEIHPLLKDPNYMPIQVISNEKQAMMADKLGIPRNNPDRTALLQAKLKQISVQTHTWWMLMAGMATPVIAALMCNRTEEPFKDLVAYCRQWKAYNWQFKSAIKNGNTEQIKKAVNNLIKATIGEGSEVTMLSRWWQKFPKKMLKVFRLDTLPLVKMLSLSEQEQLKKVSAHITNEIQNPTTFKEVIKLINQQYVTLNNTAFLTLKTALNNPILKKPEFKTAMNQWMQEIKLASDTAEGTIKHFEQLISLPLKGNPSKKELETAIRHIMEKSNLSCFEQFNRTGQIGKAVQSSGNAMQFKKIHDLVSKNRYFLAFKQMGDSPKNFILQAMQSKAMEKRWFKRFPGYIGGGMILATLLFITCVLGRDFNSTSSGDKY